MALLVSRIAFFATVFSTYVSSVEGSVLRGGDVPQPRVNADHLLEDLEEVLGAGHRKKAAARASAIEEGMRSTFMALPRSKEDLLEPTAVRYLLHRYFVDRHGWSVVGFDTDGEAENASAATVFANHGAQHVFEKRMSRGMSIHEVALLGATLESLVHTETVQRLHAAYRVLGLEDVESHPSELDARRALDVYMLSYVFGADPTTLTKERVDYMHSKVLEVYPLWREATKWIHEVRKEVLAETPEDRTSFEASVRVVETVADRYGKWQDKECIDLKESLVELERPGTGRVLLSKFYEAALNGQWQFSESKPYLQHLGVLDESDPEHPAVVISNYVNAPTNCATTSKFYSVCCINECGSLLAHLEKELAAPSASVRQIVDLVEKLPSASEDAPRSLPEKVVARLQEIADHHGGMVPLHARLFNQWMHHVYPRECPYPHLAGAAGKLKADQFAAKTGSNVYFDKAALEPHISGGSGPDHMELPWSMEEEHFFDSPQMKGASSSGFSVRGMMFGLAAVSVAATFSRMTTQSKTALLPMSDKKKFV